MKKRNVTYVCIKCQPDYEFESEAEEREHTMQAANDYIVFQVLTTVNGLEVGTQKYYERGGVFHISLEESSEQAT